MEPQAASTKPVMAWLKIVWFVVKLSLAALFIALPIRWFVAQPFIVNGTSMVPTFATGEYLVIDKLWYHFHAPQRGDVIIMRYPLDPSIYFVKRVIALPGETVSINNGVITILTTGGTSTV